MKDIPLRVRHRQGLLFASEEGVWRSGIGSDLPRALCVGNPFLREAGRPPDVHISRRFV